MSPTPSFRFRGAPPHPLRALLARLEWLALGLAGGAQVLVLLCMLRSWDGWLPLPMAQMGHVLLLALVPAALPLLFWIRRRPPACCSRWHRCWAAWWWCATGGAIACWRPSD